VQYYDAFHVKPCSAMHVLLEALVHWIVVHVTGCYKGHLLLALTGMQLMLLFDECWHRKSR
jgi:hypothetical protein